MPVMDEFKEEREKMKHQPLKVRLSYFWTYYKWFVIVGLLVIIMIVSTVKSYLDKKDYALYGVVLNGLCFTEEAPLAKDFMEYAEIDTKKYDVSFNSSLSMTNAPNQNNANASQFIMVYVAAKDLDVAAMDPHYFSNYAYNDTYMDLRELLDKDMLQKVSDKLYYIDRTVLATISELHGEGKTTDHIAIPDPFHPEDMVEPVPVGINLQECKKFSDSYYYDNNEAFLGVVINSEKKDMAAKLIEYLFTE